MSLDPNLLQQVTGAMEQVHEAGMLEGRRRAEQEYIGKSVRTLTGDLFAASLSAAAQMLRQYDPEAAQFFHDKAAEFQAWVTPPKVQVTEPQDGATGIALSNAVSVKFVAPGIRADSLTEESFYVIPASGGQHLAGTVSFDTATQTATFTPDSPLSPGVQYKAVISTDVRGAGGQTFGSDFTFLFTTAAQ